MFCCVSLSLDNRHCASIDFYTHSHLGGTEGLFAQKAIEITEAELGPYRNQGRNLPALNFSVNLPYVRITKVTID